LIWEKIAEVLMTTQWCAIASFAISAWTVVIATTVIFVRNVRPALIVNFVMTV